eukprot:CAMPEP_0181135526 /NCGR_PEP_ID=MMETSP1071-20121207/32691_1 /TAXON_ID=35127 /ORGANISM="Thalassiosira sp., Strain NH16" /LENGTH=135 /DNA_ID=CAMNT_0023222163 /DNA_START=304 /DNA_END=709 /DNA_ORIENTATION=+
MKRFLLDRLPQLARVSCHAAKLDGIQGGRENESTSGTMDWATDRAMSRASDGLDENESTNWATDERWAERAMDWATDRTMGGASNGWGDGSSDGSSDGWVDGSSDGRSMDGATDRAMGKESDRRWNGRWINSDQW